MKVIYQLNRDHIKQLYDLYQNEWWSKGRTLEETKICVDSSQICIGLIDEQGNLSGFARVLTDFVFKALIFDVIVNSTHKGKGLGRKLIDSIKTHNRLKNVKHFELYCLPALVDFYTQYGFSSEVGGVTLMRCENR